MPKLLMLEDKETPPIVKECCKSNFQRMGKQQNLTLQVNQILTHQMNKYTNVFLHMQKYRFLKDCAYSLQICKV